MAELVDATDLKSVEVNPRASSILASGTIMLVLILIGSSPTTGATRSLTA